MQEFRFQAISQKCRAIFIHPKRFKKGFTFSRLYKKSLIFLTGVSQSTIPSFQYSNLSSFVIFTIS